MVADKRESDSERESAGQRFSGWRKALLWSVGAVLLSVVGYRGAVGSRTTVIDTRVPISAANERVAPAREGLSVASIAGVSSAMGGRGEVAPSDTGVSPGASGAPAVSANPGGAGASEKRGADGDRGAPGRGERGGAAAEGAAGGSPQAITADGRIVLNLATEAELRKLPGIGKARARAILEQRERVGRFRRLEELLRVKGIGPRRLAVLRPKVVLDAPPREP